LRDFEKDHWNIEEKMPSCDDCGLMFENIWIDDVQKITIWSGKEKTLKTIINNLKKKSRLEEQAIIDEGEDIAFTKLTELAREANEDKWESKVDKYVNDGLTEEEARIKANRKLNDVDLDQFMSSMFSNINPQSSQEGIFSSIFQWSFSKSLKYVCLLWGLSSNWLTSRVSLFIYSSTLPPTIFGEQRLLSDTLSNI
jgi:hypothetical protein